jgi:hypothetical protein
VRSNIPEGGQPSQGTRVVHRREPDAQFQHRDAEYPGVVLEVSYSQDGKDLKKLAWDYIQYSNGDIKVVIGIDIKYSNTKEATLSVWRPRYIREDGEELEILEAEERIIPQVCHLLHGHGAEANLGKAFRAGDGSFDNSTNVLCLSLDDFATDEISTNRHFGDSTEVNISYKKLAQFLNRAEEMQESREPTQGSRGHSAKSKRKTRKRKRSSSPCLRMRQSARTRRQWRRRGLTQRMTISVLGLWSKPMVNNLDVALGKHSEKLERWFYYFRPLSHDEMDVTREP